MSVIDGYAPQDYLALEPLARAIHAKLPPCPLQYHREWKIAIDAPDKLGSGARAYVAREEGQIVGYGSLWPLHSPTAIRMHILVAPARQRQGIGGRLYERLLADLLPLQAPCVQARIRDALPQVLAFAARRGFEAVQHMVYLRLHVSDADTASFAPVLQNVAERGIVLTTLAEEQQREPACLEKLWDLYNVVHPDTPEGQISSSPPLLLETLLRILETDLPAAHFIAKVGEQYVGWSPLTLQDAEEGAINVGSLTGVRREYRRQGVATALKVRTIRYAQEHGFKAIVTKTANPAMLALSEKLGFRRESGEVRLLKSLLPLSTEGDKSDSKTE